MNKDVLMEVVNWLEAGTPEHKGVVRFDMGDFIQKKECGTICCIGGAIVEFNGGYEGSWGGVELRASQIANITDMQGYQLFYPHNMDRTPQQAAKVIRHLIETNEVDWNI